jgi:hypothetical protein
MKKVVTHFSHSSFSTAMLRKEDRMDDSEKKVMLHTAVQPLHIS